ncbi:uncharacterized protein LOC109601592 isoform X3 [Aethina tumida]|uniref:uncharacterized protein LOC109601592 isoform X3 n=1 Tax=Aethina tumida TaxID=116153 RepID=UPI00214741E8|nr:uncharacterized protein LOC109601592 isoform X3 [Aethina tumida]
MSRFKSRAAPLLLLMLALARAHPECGGTFTAVRGVLQTPGFPKPFPVPIHCKWIIDASHLSTDKTSIVVYLTQLFVFGGLTFTDYVFYDRNFPVMGKVLHKVNETNVIQARWVRTNLTYLVIELDLESDVGEHLRVLDNFLDVYGFNITYEITDGGIRPNSCTMMTCGFTGICYDHFNKFSCDCFDGYTGPQCSDGPKSLCYNNGVPTCKNNATCVHCGTPAIICHCKEGYAGRTCENRVPASPKRGCNNCPIQCPNEKGNSKTGSNDMIGYSATMHLSNLPNQDDSKLQNYIKIQLLRAIRSNFSKVDNVSIDSVNHFMSGVDVAFHFYWLKREEKKVRAVLSKWVEKGYFGNITVLDKELQLRTVLSIQSFTVNQPGILRRGDEVILSCVARGSPSMTFRWFKEHLSINVTSESHKWTRLIKDPHVQDQYTALLAVQKADYLDDGLFICQVEDFNVQQCMSHRIQVGKPPNIKIEPMSITVQKGENFTIKCITQDDTNGRIFNYIWTKSKTLLPVKTDTERYEVLYPSGSILQIFNAERDVQYSCKVQDGSTLSSEKVVNVYVVNKIEVGTCPRHVYLNQSWPETAPHYGTVQPCPEGYAGTVYRGCILRDGKNPSWDTPDFSQCTHNKLVRLQKLLELLKLGYVSMSPERLFQTILKQLQITKSLLPGEGARHLAIINEMLDYLRRSRSSINSLTNLTLASIDRILMDRNSLLNQTHVQMVPQVLETYLEIFTPVLIGNESSSQITYPTLGITLLNLTCINERNFYIPPLGVNNDDLKGITIDGRFLLEKDKDKNNMLTMTVYKNISVFLPPRSYLRIKDGSEIQYEIVSDVLTFESDAKINSLQISFPARTSTSRHDNYSASDVWSVRCASADVASFTYTWDIYSCKTQTLDDATVQCDCPYSETVALLLTTTPLKSSASDEDDPRRYVLIGGCSLCMALALFTTACLATSCWMQRLTCLIFLKLQCSLSIFCSALLFTLATVTGPSKIYYIYFITSLETFILLALSSHLSKLLIVFTELVHLPRPVTSKETVIGIISGVPIITVFGSHIAYRTMDIKLSSWWMIVNSFSFNLYVTVIAIITLLFIFVYVTVMKKLRVLAQQHAKHEKSINKRAALLRRSACLFTAISILSISSIVYVNKPHPIWSLYQFAGANVVLGVVLIVCYVIRGETEFHSLFHATSKLNKDDKFFSVDSTSSPLNYVNKPYVFVNT